MQSDSADVVSNVFNGWGYMLKIGEKNDKATFLIQINVWDNWSSKLGL